ncbi:hypothetical protein CHL67_06265 [Prosthecochloris sp. GSB1]|uniref:hypothetical protein n=1 Tax=Prosthecochloris sp. GSB1 TaxID=281093 RepID=UPI000B8CC913|nr:hypothetical protein [Prosthecochloris sp. GSB1]ASQ90579.1 hypothetical protein CHL67_06265 [Prosthecochloris sp. GSB1]
MARKKSFSGGINSLLEGSVREPSAAKSPDRPDEKAPDGPRAPKTKIASFVVNTDTLDAMRALAYWERKKIKDILEESMRQLIASKGDAYVENALVEYHKSLEEDR